MPIAIFYRKGKRFSATVAHKHIVLMVSVRHCKKIAYLLLDFRSGAVCRAYIRPYRDSEQYRHKYCGKHAYYRHNHNKLNYSKAFFLM